MRARKSCLPGLKKPLSAATYSRSRSVFAEGDCAFCISTQLFATAVASGRSQIWWNWLIATPQCAIAQLGSAFSICSNCRCASSYQKSCSKATPRLKGACTAAEHETEKETVPRRSGEAAAEECMDSIPPDWAATGRAVRASSRDASIFIALDYRTRKYGVATDRSLAR